MHHSKLTERQSVVAEINSVGLGIYANLQNESMMVRALRSGHSGLEKYMHTLLSLSQHMFR